MTAIQPPAVLLEVDIQIALNDNASSDCEEPPSAYDISHWALTAYSASSEKPVAGEATIRLVTEQEIQSLNNDYRQQDKPTNVLAFPFDMPDLSGLSNSIESSPTEMPYTLLGDVVICHSVVAAEAKQQNKTLNDHYAHIVTHGILHLCGYDHIDEQDATTMEALEISILAQHGIANPYH